MVIRNVLENLIIENPIEYARECTSKEENLRSLKNVLFVVDWMKMSLISINNTRNSVYEWMNEWNNDAMQSDGRCLKRISTTILSKPHSFIQSFIDLLWSKNVEAGLWNTSV